MQTSDNTRIRAGGANDNKRVDCDKPKFYLCPAMKHISIIIPQGQFSLVNVEGAHHLFGWSNQLLAELGRKPMFTVELVGLKRSATICGGLYTIHPQRLIGDVKRTNLIILPAVHSDQTEALRLNAQLLPWLVDQHRRGAEIASFCVGSFLLAATGLLAGRACSTHWRYAQMFRALYPDALLTDDKIVTDADGIYTSGGAYSFTNLLVYLVEKYAGRDVALLTARTFMIDLGQHSQGAFALFAGQKDHGDATVLEAQAFIESNVGEKLSVDAVLARLPLGRRTFERRFKKATANSVGEYIQRVKMEAAKKALESGRANINEAMWEVGYSDAKAFRDVFRKTTGLSPAAYRARYSVGVSGE